MTLLLAAAGLPANAQNQSSSNTQGAPDTSLGTYARQIRKEPGAAAKPKVFDNDNLPTEDKLSVVGSATPTNDNSNVAKQQESSGAAPTSEAKPGTEAKSGTADTGAAAAPGLPADPAARDAAWKQWGDRIAEQQKQIDLLTRELDVAQKEYQLRAAAMYADVGNRLRNSADWDKQDAQYKQQIADKQKALDDAKQKLDDLQEEARKAGVPSSAREP